MTLNKRLVAIFFISASVFTGMLLTLVPKEGENLKMREKMLRYEDAEYKSGYYLKDYNGRLSVFREGENFPEMIFSVYTDNLPDIDKFKLKDGIYAENYEALLSLIEDYTS